MSTTTEAAPSLAELKQAALIRRAPRTHSILGPCECLHVEAKNLVAYADCPRCKGKGDHPVKLKPHPQCVDQALRCQCGRLMTVGLSNVLIGKNGRVTRTENDVKVAHWCCPKCPETHSEPVIRAVVIGAFLDASAEKGPKGEKRAMKLYRFLKARGRAMHRLGLGETAIAKGETT